MAIADKLNELVIQRDNLANNLNTMGVSASTDETLSTLVPKVLDIETGGGGTEVEKGIIINEYDSDGYPTDVELVGMTAIPDYYFYSSTSGAIGSFFIRINKIKLSDNVTTIGDHCFYDCIKLVLTSLPEGITLMKSYAFYNCNELALTSLPEGITLIDTYTFQNCSKLALTSLPKKITEIRANSFRECTKIETLDISSDVLKTIGNYAFNSCSNLKQVIFKRTTPPSLGSGVFNSTPIASGTGYIYVPDESVNTYKSATNWSAYASAIKGLSELEA